MFSKEEFYSALCERHTKEAQDKLINAKVAILGLGGLGSNIAFSLARLGVGNICIMDFDIVDITNIFRQNYRISHVGRLKTQCLKEEIEEINPYINVEIKNIKITTENVNQLISDYDIICEAFDSSATKAEIINEILEKTEDKIVISGNGMAGYKDCNLIKTRKFGSRLYICGDLKNGIEVEKTLMAPRVCVCAMHEANVVLNIILE